MMRPRTCSASLWAQAPPLWALAGVTTALLAAMWRGALAPRGRFGCCGGLARAVSAAVQGVGVYPVFSSLIIRALATDVFAERIAGRLH